MEIRENSRPRTHTDELTRSRSPSPRSRSPAQYELERPRTPSEPNVFSNGYGSSFDCFALFSRCACFFKLPCKRQTAKVEVTEMTALMDPQLRNMISPILKDGTLYVPTSLKVRVVIVRNDET